MRIISGLHKGRKITAPKNLPIRPTTDMAKEALFNILNNQYYFDEISVLDLFAGSGNISYEFASRGCKQLMAIEIHPGCTDFIEKTAQNLELPIRVLKSDVATFMHKTTDLFDVIFADPPYDFEVEKFLKIADLAFEKKLLLDGGILIIEHSKHTDLASHDRFS